MVRVSSAQVLALFLLVGCHGKSTPNRTGPGNPDGAPTVDVGAEPDVYVSAVDASLDAAVRSADAPLNEDLVSPSLDAGINDTNPKPVCTREQMYPSAPCRTGWFLFTDTRSFLCTPSDKDPACSPTPGYVTEPWGDDSCYRPCKTKADCPDPCLPFCRQIWLYNGNERCSTTTSVCLAQDRDFCDSVPSRSSN